MATGKPQKRKRRNRALEAAKQIQHEKDQMVACLREGMSVRAAIQKLGMSQRKHYYHRKHDSAYLRACNHALSAQEVKRNDSYDTPKNRKRIGGNLIRFLTLYRTGGDRSRASRMADVSPLEVEGLINPDSETFNDCFHGIYRDIEIRHLWEVEDNAMEEAKKNATQARFMLQARLPDRYVPTPEAQGAGEQNSFWFQIGGDAAEDVVEKILESVTGDELKAGKKKAQKTAQGSEAETERVGEFIKELVDELGQHDPAPDMGN